MSEIASEDEVIVQQQVNVEGNATYVNAGQAHSAEPGAEELRHLPRRAAAAELVFP